MLPPAARAGETAHDPTSDHVCIQQLPYGLSLLSSEVHLHILKGALLAAEGGQYKLVRHVARGGRT